jgi:predicted Zn-dependent peptidase
VDGYADRLDKVTPRDVTGVAAKYLGGPDRYVTVVLRPCPKK